MVSSRFPNLKLIDCSGDIILQIRRRAGEGVLCFDARQEISDALWVAIQDNRMAIGAVELPSYAVEAKPDVRCTGSIWAEQRNQHRRFISYQKSPIFVAFGESVSKSNKINSRTGHRVQIKPVRSHFPRYSASVDASNRR